jgi:hypothetical protein
MVHSSQFSWYNPCLKKCEAETKQTLNFKTPKDDAAAN